MSEFSFALKCLGYTLLIAFLMQIKVSGISIEARAEHILRDSQVTEYLQQASDGGARLLQKGYYTSKDFISGIVHTDSSRSVRSSR